MTTDFFQRNWRKQHFDSEKNRHKAVIENYEPDTKRQEEKEEEEKNKRKQSTMQGIKIAKHRVKLTKTPISGLINPLASTIWRKVFRGVKGPV